jgi:hypothetical protein
MAHRFQTTSLSHHQLYAWAGSTMVPPCSNRSALPCTQQAGIPDLIAGHFSVPYGGWQEAWLESVTYINTILITPTSHYPFPCHHHPTPPQSSSSSAAPPLQPHPQLSQAAPNHTLLARSGLRQANMGLLNPQNVLGASPPSTASNLHPRWRPHLLQ